MNKLPLTLLFVAVAAGALYLGYSNRPQVQPQPEPPPPVPQSMAPLLSSVDRDVPEFSLEDTSGKQWQKDALEGKPYLINFWAVWCPPCLEELPSLNALWSELEPEGVGMLAINIGEEADSIDRFLQEHNLTIDFPVVVGDKHKSLGNWMGRSLPFTVIVNPDGKVVYEAIGEREWNEKRIVDAILALKNV